MTFCFLTFHITTLTVGIAFFSLINDINYSCVSVSLLCVFFADHTSITSRRAHQWQTLHQNLITGVCGASKFHLNVSAFQSCTLFKWSIGLSDEKPGFYSYICPCREVCTASAAAPLKLKSHNYKKEIPSWTSRDTQIKVSLVYSNKVFHFYFFESGINRSGTKIGGWRCHGNHLWVDGDVFFVFFFPEPETEDSSGTQSGCTRLCCQVPESSQAEAICHEWLASAFHFNGKSVFNLKSPSHDGNQ